MPAFIITLVVGVICIILGASNMRGNISSLHSYHRHRVSDDDILPFGRMVGLGTIICGVGLIFMGVFSFLATYFEESVYLTVGSIGLVVGLVIGLGIAFYAMIKYNKGIF